MKKFFKLVFTIMFVIAAIGCKGAEAVNDSAQNNSQIQLEETTSKDIPKIILRDNPNDITIFGEPVATQEQMVQFILRRNPNPKINCSVEDLVRYYYEEGKLEGIRPDIAICQAIKETGTWNYGGDVVPEQNNYCGLGTTGGGVKGGYFPTPQIGVRAHIQHLLVYTSTRPTKLENVDPRYEHIVNNRRDVFGNIHTWVALNGVWAAPGIGYGQDILALWQEAQAMFSGNVQIPMTREGDSIEDRAANFVLLGLINFGNKEFGKAEENFQSAVELTPNDTDALWDLALAQEKNGKFDAAIATYDKILQLTPDFKNGYYNRGLLKLMKNDFDGAIKDFQATNPKESRFVEAQNEIAVAHFRQGMYDEALKDLEVAVKINTTNEIVNSNYAKLKAYLGK